MARRGGNLKKLLPLKKERIEIATAVASPAPDYRPTGEGSSKSTRTQRTTCNHEELSYKEKSFTLARSRCLRFYIGPLIACRCEIWPGSCDDQVTRIRVLWLWEYKHCGIKESWNVRFRFLSQRYFPFFNSIFPDKAVFINHHSRFNLRSHGINFVPVIGTSPVEWCFRFSL